MPEGILEGIEKAGAIRKCGAIVIIWGAAGRTFIAGADIKEFGKITTGGGPDWPCTLPTEDEDSEEPGVMAIHGTALEAAWKSPGGHYAWPWRPRRWVSRR